ncbi:tRNA(Ile)-lysidine synthase [Lachnospiraceae bacterium]|nr:tRNA(Ile)-lysidine synthase [Lachnospiraceae bacterium]
MIDKVLEYIKKYHMIEKGDCVVAGVSGGADSICLLLMLLELSKQIPIKLRVVHVNHQIRTDAAADAEYVRKVCLTEGLPFTLVEQDVEAFAKQRHISTEEAGRIVRYNAFAQELGQNKGKIAVAHNKNDCCETFLFHLFRGTSIKGLKGIPPVRGKIIRPLLCLTRSEIELFLQERNTPYCIDSTNLVDNYSRNIIRHHILDTAMKKINSAATEHIYDACGRISDAYELIVDLTRQAFIACVKQREGAFYIDRENFLQLHRTIQGYLIMEVLAQASGSKRDLGAVHVGQVQKLMNSQCGKVITLPHQLRAERTYTGIILYKSCMDNAIRKTALGASLPEIVLSATDENALRAGEELVFSVGIQQTIHLRTISVGENGIDFENIPQNKYTKWIDYGKIKNSIVIRTRRPGDYLTVNSMNQHKTLKSYFIDRKIPQKERDQICLLVDGRHVVWIVGERISNYYKVSKNTKTVLCIIFEDS